MTYEQWLELAGWQSHHVESGIERFDGQDLTEHLQAEYRRYLAELDQSDPAVLEQFDLSDQLTVTTGSDGQPELYLPEPYRRLVAVQLRGWTRPATIVDATKSMHSQAADQPASLLECLGNPYAEPGICRPLAVRYGRRYILYPKTTDNKLTTATAV